MTIQVLFDADREAAGDITQRYVGDGGVAHHHERRDRDDGGDRPPSAIACRRAALIAQPGCCSDIGPDGGHDRHAGVEQRVGRLVE